METINGNRRGKTWAMSKALEQKINNTTLWINGADKHNWQGLPNTIDTAEREYNQRIRALEARISSCNQKEIKGSKYWYEWQDGQHKYRGKTDPRPPYEAQVQQLQDELKKKIEPMKSCIIKTVGKHLVIDVSLYREHVSKKTIGDQVNIGEVLA